MASVEDGEGSAPHRVARPCRAGVPALGRVAGCASAHRVRLGRPPKEKAPLDESDS